MGMLGDHKMPAKALDPIPGRTQEVHLLFMLLRRGLPLLGGQMAGVFGHPGLVKDGRVVTAVKSYVGLHKEGIAEEAPPVPEGDLQYIVGLTSLAPIGRTFL